MKDERLEAYRELHNGLSDMIEGKRLKREDIPDDYGWLVETLHQIVALDPETDA